MMSSDEGCSKVNMESTEFQVEEGEMDLRDKNALIQCRTKIIKDLDVRIIIDALLETRIVDENLYEKIKNEVSSKFDIFSKFVKVRENVIFVYVLLFWPAGFTRFCDKYGILIVSISKFQSKE